MPARISLPRHFLCLRSDLCPALLGSFRHLCSRSSGQHALPYAGYFSVRRIAQSVRSRFYTIQLVPQLTHLLFEFSFFSFDRR